MAFLLVLSNDHGESSLTGCGQPAAQVQYLADSMAPPHPTDPCGRQERGGKPPLIDQSDPGVEVPSNRSNLEVFSRGTD
jgi:hypothetical protein